MAESGGAGLGWARTPLPEGVGGQERPPPASHLHYREQPGPGGPLGAGAAPPGAHTALSPDSLTARIRKWLSELGGGGCSQAGTSTAPRCLWSVSRNLHLAVPTLVGFRLLPLAPEIRFPFLCLKVNWETECCVFTLRKLVKRVCLCRKRSHRGKANPLFSRGSLPGHAVPLGTCPDSRGAVCPDARWEAHVPRSHVPWGGRVPQTLIH